MDYSYDIMRMTKIRFYEWDRSELKFCCERMARLRNLVRKSGPRGFRAVLFRMVPKRTVCADIMVLCFRAVLFRMVPKHYGVSDKMSISFRAVLFRMVPKQKKNKKKKKIRIRTILYRIITKNKKKH